MKRIITSVLIAVLLAPAIIALPVAHAEESATTTAATTTKSEGEKKVEAEAAKKTAAQRIKERQAALKLATLTSTEQANIKGKCKAAQVKLKDSATKLNSKALTRSTSYDQIVKNLEKLSTKLKAKNVDVTELNTEITELKAKIDTYKIDLAEYKVSLGDVRDIDCVTDPAAFKTALEAARVDRKVVEADAKAITLYITETIKVTLKEIKTSLQAKEDTSSTDSTTATGGAQ